MELLLILGCYLFRKPLLAGVRKLATHLYGLGFRKVVPWALVIAAIITGFVYRAFLVVAVRDLLLLIMLGLVSILITDACLGYLKPKRG